MHGAPIPQTATDGAVSLITDVGLPIIVALLTYLVVDRLGEWKKRRDQSRLGIAILDEFLEEIRNAVLLLEANHNPTETTIKNMYSNQSWSDGMRSLPDEVLLRIMATTQGKSFPGPYNPQHIRSHLKNVFVNIYRNYDNGRQDAIRHFVDGDPQWQQYVQKVASSFVQPFRDVITMVEFTRGKLNRNAKWYRPFPR